MSLKDYITIGMAVVALLISCVSLWRTVRSSRENRELQFAQRRQDALTRVSNLQSGLIAITMKTQIFMIKASQAGLSISSDRVLAPLATYAIAEERLRGTAALLMGTRSRGRTHKDLLQLIETANTTLDQTAISLKGVTDIVDDMLQDIEKSDVAMLNEQIQKIDALKNRLEATTQADPPPTAAQ
jgi:hypothetical protein